MFLLVCVSLFTLASAQPKFGPYQSLQKKYDVPSLDSTNPSAWVWYPVSNQTSERFPLIAYLHGAAGIICIRRYNINI
jgi:acetyl esterase/lipase